jgi:hypothetical protein
MGRTNIPATPCITFPFVQERCGHGQHGRVPPGRGGCRVPRQGGGNGRAGLISPRGPAGLISPRGCARLISPRGRARSKSLIVQPAFFYHPPAA